MVQPWEVSQRQAAEQRERLTRAKRTRELFVWVLIERNGLDGRHQHWVPGVLSEWRRSGRDWVGQVAYVIEYFNDGSMHGKGMEWRADLRREWMPARRLRVIMPQPERPGP